MIDSNPEPLNPKETEVIRFLKASGGRLRNPKSNAFKVAHKALIKRKIVKEKKVPTKTGQEIRYEVVEGY